MVIRISGLVRRGFASRLFSQKLYHTPIPNEQKELFQTTMSGYGAVLTDAFHITTYDMFSMQEALQVSDELFKKIMAKTSPKDPLDRKLFTIDDAIELTSKSHDKPRIIRYFQEDMQGMYHVYLAALPGGIQLYQTLTEALKYAGFDFVHCRRAVTKTH